MNKILEIWGNKKDVIIKFTKEGFTNIWWSSSKWFKNNPQYTNEFLLKQGYRKLNIKETV